MRTKKMDKNILLYDSGDDSLTFIHKDLRAKHTINTGLALISLDAKGKVAALELLGVEKNFSVKKAILENLKEAEIKLQTNKELKLLIINITLLFENKEIIINTTAKHKFVATTNSSFKAVSCV